MNNLSHLGIIPDGNRRWASSTNTDLSEAYLKSCRNLLLIVSKLFKKHHDLSDISIYLLSYENISNRSKEEINLILDVGEKMFATEGSTILNQVNLNWVGLDEFRKLGFSHNIINKVKESNAICNYHTKTIHLVAGYDPELDILKNYSKDNNTISALAIKSNIDLVIRTGNVQRLSGFLPFHTKYSEFSFLTKAMPEISCDDIENEIIRYRNIDRRYGR